MKKLLTLTCTIPGLLLLSCDKEKVAQPMPSSSSYFTCKVNGEPWTAETPPNINGPIPIVVEYMPDQDALSITAIRKFPDQSFYDRIYFSLLDIHDPDEVVIYPGQGQSVGFSDYVSNYACGEYFHDTAFPGTIMITQHDTMNRTLTAAFSVTLKNTDCSPDSLLYITNGTMKINY